MHKSLTCVAALCLVVSWWASAQVPILGMVVTAGKVSVGRRIAPTGTTIFSGDRVAADKQPALIIFQDGGQLEMFAAAATLTRQGEGLSVRADYGLIRFSFRQDLAFTINAGNYRITGVGNSIHAGVLDLNRDGRATISTSAGIYAILNTATGKSSQLQPMAIAALGPGLAAVPAIAIPPGPPPALYFPAEGSSSARLQCTLLGVCP
jgi:hypothetical protein